MLLLFLPAAQPALLRVELIERVDVADGRAFGSAGAYERIKAKAHFAVDPAHAANREITDIELAPRNAAGLVEFAADLHVLKPRDPALGNRIALFEVPNRGGRGMGNTFGETRLLEQGYTLVWLGWQHDVPRKPDLLRLHAPVAKDVEGWVRSEFTASSKAPMFPMGDAGHVPYAIADAARAKVTVRDGMLGQRRELARDQWSIEGEAVRVAGGLEPGRIYEIVYPSREAVVTGLGLAGIRDLMSFLRYGENSVTLLGDQRRFLKHTIGFGTSQSAMVLRAMLLGGFNADEKGRRVFDGIFANVAGGRRSSFHRFAQPSRTAGPHRNSTFAGTDTFPFTDAETTDGGVRGGLLTRYTAETTPKIVYTNSSYEYWGSAASLTHTAADGVRDVALPPTTRVYLMAGGQHGPGPFPPRMGAGRNPSNPNQYGYVLRGLLEAMRQWVVDGVAPPESRYPTIAGGTLVAASAVKFPAVPGVTRPQGVHPFVRGTAEKPGRPFVSLTPQVDADGNDLGGVRTPELAHPLATYTGWNLRTEAMGASNDLAANLGSYLPFARTKAEREAQRDPRRSIAERYQDEQHYLRLIRASAMELVEQRFLLERDVDAVVKAAEARWRWHQAQQQSRLE